MRYCTAFGGVSGRTPPIGKHKLLMTSYQTPDVELVEDCGTCLCPSLYICSTGTESSSTMGTLSPSAQRTKTRELPPPSMVQRNLPRIIRQIGTPASLPKPRGKSPGRAKGYSPGKRERLPVVIKKGKSDQTHAQAPKRELFASQYFQKIINFRIFLEAQKEKFVQNPKQIRNLFELNTQHLL